jgi:hypothetical protein
MESHKGEPGKPPMEKVRAYADDHGDERQFLGAIAYTLNLYNAY